MAERKYNQVFENAARALQSDSEYEPDAKDSVEKFKKMIAAHAHIVQYSRQSEFPNQVELCFQGRQANGDDFENPIANLMDFIKESDKDRGTQYMESDNYYAHDAVNDLYCVRVANSFVDPILAEPRYKEKIDRRGALHSEQQKDVSTLSADEINALLLPASITELKQAETSSANTPSTNITTAKTLPPWPKQKLENDQDLVELIAGRSGLLIAGSYRNKEGMFCELWFPAQTAAQLAMEYLHANHKLTKDTEPLAQKFTIPKPPLSGEYYHIQYVDLRYLQELLKTHWDQLSDGHLLDPRCDRSAPPQSLIEICTAGRTGIVAAAWFKNNISNQRGLMERPGAILA